MTKTKEDVLRIMSESNVHYVRLYFTDILGRLKGIAITNSELEGILQNGQGFDGSSIEGFVRIEESDLVAVPDLRTFRVIPWEVGGQRTAMMFCDIQTPDGNPYEGDPRYILQKVLKKIADKGWKFYVGPELEYFYFASDQEPEIIDQAGYFDYTSADMGTQLRKQTSAALEMMGVQVECSHHEVAPSQQEIDLKYNEALIMADFVQIYKFVVKEIAMQNDIFASFMPKPILGENGSGMHVHMSLFEGDTNIFFDPKSDNHLSEIALKFLSGILYHVKSMTLVLNQWVNSYKRLVAGYEAPVYISWGTRNRSSLVRVPTFKSGYEKGTRIELRSADPACNPYLVFALMLAAGLDGIENNRKLPKPIEENIFEMGADVRKKRKIESLPDSLERAIYKMSGSSLVKDTLGEHIFSTLLANKKVESDEYKIAVTDYELRKYLPFL